MTERFLSRVFSFFYCSSEVEDDEEEEIAFASRIRLEEKMGTLLGF